jgi:hypothetical protein
MRTFNRITKKSAIAAAGAVVVLGAGGTAWAVEASSSSPAAASTSASTPASTAPSPSSGPATHARRAKSLLERADRATVEVKVKGQWVTYDIDRGHVSAVSASSIALQLPDGTSVTEAITPTTRFKGVTSASSVVVGHVATVISTGGNAIEVEQARRASTPPATGSPAA